MTHENPIRNKFWALGRQIAIVTGLREPIRDLLQKQQARRDKARIAQRFRRFCAALDREAASAEITAVILTVEPSHLFEQCLESVKNQSLLPGCVEIVRNVMPVSKASQEGLDRVKTSFFVVVDEDMILHPTCFERLYYLLNSQPNCAEALARLEDPILGEIYGIRMYRTGTVRPIGFHPLENSKAWDRYMTEELAKRGYLTIHSEVVEGEHHPVYLPHEAFWKFRFISEKLRYYEYDMSSFYRHVDLLVDYWKRKGDVIAFYGLAGLFDGLQSTHIDGELSYDGRQDYAPFRRVQEFIEKVLLGEKEI